MPPKATKPKRKSKKQKKIKYIPDPDLAFKEHLNEEYYVAKLFREKRDEELALCIENAITASTFESFEHGTSLDKIPADRLGFICASLDLSLSSLQLEQLKVMATYPLKSSVSQDATEHAVSLEAQSENLADKKRLKNILLELLHTRILSFDAQLLAQPDSRFPTRALSIVYSADQLRIQKCFEALWSACGSQYTLTKGNEKVRCLGVGELRDFLGKNGSSELPLTDLELRDFVLAFEDPGENLIREDNFLLTMENVL